MVVKIFYPKSLFFRKEECHLYGEVAISEKSITYAIITDENEYGCRHLGCVLSAGRQTSLDVSLKFCYDNFTPNVYLKDINIKTNNPSENMIILYEPSEILQLNSAGKSPIEENNDVNLLKFILESYRKPKEDWKHKCYKGIIKAHTIFCLTRKTIISFLYEKFKNVPLVSDLFSSWRIFMEETAERPHILQTLFDIFIGLCTMWLIITNTDSVQHIADFSKNAIYQLKALLQSLKGTPIGLKLNEQLNNFFLDFSTYHVDLWVTFLQLCEPILFYLMVPIAFLGTLGLSFQLAILSNLLILGSLHAQCIYIYATILYKIEKTGIATLWNVVLGRRRNILKDRVESHDYVNRQLYLTTVFFTTMLFLFPTIFVYYVVFAVLRLILYFINCGLLKIQRKLLQFPIENFLKWICGCYYDIGDIELEYLERPDISGCPSTLILCLNAKRSFPWKSSIIITSKNGEKNYIECKEERSTLNVLKAVACGNILNFE